MAWNPRDSRMEAETEPDGRAVEAKGMQQRRGVSKDNQEHSEKRVKGTSLSCLSHDGAREHLVSIVNIFILCRRSKARGQPVEDLFSPSTM